MEKWRSIDYNKRLRRELEKIQKSPISETNKKLILKYKNWRIGKA